MTEAMAKLEGACLAMRESNDERHQKSFTPLLDRLGLIIANVRDGITLTHADDLANVRSALRRLRLPDINPGLEAPAPALLAVHSGCANLIEALGNALDAAGAIGDHPRAAKLAGIRIERHEITEQLIRLDERLCAIEEGIADLCEEAMQADALGGGKLPVQQVGLVNVYVRTLAVEISAARFETRIDNRPEAAGDIDLTALSRSVESIREIAGDLREAVGALSDYMAEGVRAAGRVVVRAAERSWHGWRAVVRTVHRRVSRGAAALRSDTPADFNLDRIRAMIRSGREPPEAWVPWITKLEFSEKNQIHDLTPLTGLAALQYLYLNRTQVSDLAPLVGLTALERLYLNRTQVSDLAPLVGLTALERLYVNRTQVSDLAPLAGLTALQYLELNGTRVSDPAPLAGLTALKRLDLDSTQISDVAPLAGLTSLQYLDLSGTQVSNLAPLAGLTALKHLDLDGIQVSDLAPLASLIALKRLDLDGAQVSDLEPLASLIALKYLYLNGTQVNDLEPLVGLTALERLYLNHTPVRDVAPLVGLTALRYLDLSGTQVNDVAPLAHIRGLNIVGVRKS